MFKSFASAALVGAVSAQNIPNLYAEPVRFSHHAVDPYATYMTHGPKSYLASGHEVEMAAHNMEHYGVGNESEEDGLLYGAAHSVLPVPYEPTSEMYQHGHRVVEHRSPYEPGYYPGKYHDQGHQIDIGEEQTPAEFHHKYGNIHPIGEQRIVQSTVGPTYEYGEAVGVHHVPEYYAGAAVAETGPVLQFLQSQWPQPQWQNPQYGFSPAPMPKADPPTPSPSPSPTPKPPTPTPSPSPHPSPSPTPHPSPSPAPQPTPAPKPPTPSPSPDTKDPFTCYRSAIFRGPGTTINYCRDGEYNTGINYCMQKCAYGYRAGGDPVSYFYCYKDCPQGFKDTGTHCKKTLGYGTGTEQRRKCDKGSDSLNLGWHCSQDCPEGYHDNGTEFCAKPKYGRQMGHPATCKPNQDQIGLWCYDKCESGLTGFGPLCMRTCPYDRKQCGGILCLNPKETCTGQVMKSLQDLEKALETAGGAIGKAAAAYQKFSGNDADGEDNAIVITASDLGRLTNADSQHYEDLLEDNSMTDWFSKGQKIASTGADLAKTGQGAVQEGQKVYVDISTFAKDFKYPACPAPHDERIQSAKKL